MEHNTICIIILHCRHIDENIIGDIIAVHLHPKNLDIRQTQFNIHQKGSFIYMPRGTLAIK